MARTDRNAMEDVLERFREAENARLGIEDQWIRNYLQYRGISSVLESRRRNNRAGIFVPYTFSVVETAVARTTRSLLSERPYVHVLPLPGTSYEQAAAMQDLLDYQFAEPGQVNLLRVTVDAIRQALFYGIAPVEIGWKKVVRSRRSRRMENGVLGEAVPSEYVAYDGPSLEVVDPFGFYWDPFARCREELDFVIVRTFRTRRWLEEAGRAKIFKKVGEAIQTSLPAGLPSWLEERRRITGWADTWRRDLYEVLTLWTPHNVTAVVNRQVVVRNEPNPFWHGELPFVVATDTRLPQEFAGLGTVMPIQDLQEELNAKRNQRLDNVNLVINKMFKVLRGADLDESELLSRPGGIVHVDTHDDVQEFQFDDVTSSSYQEEAVIKDDLQRTSGVYEVSMGATPARRETATTVVSLQNAADERTRLKVELLANEFILPLARQVAMLNQQFITAERVLPITGPFGLPIAVHVVPEGIAGEFHFRLAGATVDTVADRQFKLNQLIQLLGIVNQAPGVNVGEFVRRILQLAEVRDIDSIVPPSQLQQVLAAMGEAQSVPNLPNEAVPGIGMTARIGPTPFEQGVPQ